jgi:uncharacterized protein (TIGR00288 family)
MNQTELDWRSSQVAVFFDYDNQRVDLIAVLEHLKEIGRVVIRRAYGDWVRDRIARAAMAEQEVELIDRPRFGTSDRQGNDILLTADCMEIALTRPNISTIVIVSGDSDFIPLISRLKALGKRVVLVSSEMNISPRLKRVCDQFISYEAIAKAEELVVEDQRERAFANFRRVRRLFRERGETLTPARCHQAMIQLDPSFDPRAIGFQDFNAFFNEASRIEGDETETVPAESLEEDQRWEWLASSIYTVLDRLDEMGTQTTPAAIQQMFKQMMPNFKVQRFGQRRFSELIARLVRRGYLERQGEILVMPRDVAWKRMLRRANLRPHPALRPAFVREFCRRVSSLEPERRTLSQIAETLRASKSIPELTRRPLNELMRAAKFSGLLTPYGSEGYITFHTPFEYTGDETTLERGMVKVYLKRMLEARTAEAGDWPIMSSILFGWQGQEALVHELIHELVEEGEVIHEGTKYRYIRGASVEGLIEEL